MKKFLIALAFGASISNPALAFGLGDLLGGGGSGSGGGLDLGKVVKAVSSAGEALKDYTPEQEDAIGRRVMADLLGAAPLVNNPGMQRYVNQIGLWVALQSERPNLPWRFGVTDDLHVNSFAAPGGYILITRGLYDRLHSEAELASVLAHEIAHVVKGHQIRAMKSAKGGEFLSTTAKIVAESRGRSEANYAANAFSGGTEIFVRGMDKNDEFEADVYGMVLAARAGYNPFALPAVLTTIGNINPKDDAVGLLFSTHPSPRERLDKIEESVGDKLDQYANGVDNTPVFRRIHAR
ncbi:Peptidase family M48 [Formivibrio citricus]|uniref:Peptidase family M48 n=1 Tax=Formivibrio citricus TaxID=83765 RepID=A0A1I5CCH8_9NEIS|nr:M48 family metalloprotease [Formivibrio citricus]SFN84740.1 Peptidase family M48 [Formivibrio citricus]